MNKQQIGTKLTLDALGVSLDLRTFDERLIVQKTVYLAQAAGVDRGYSFRWYLRGPYSPELTRDAFSLHADLEAGLDESSGWVLDDNTLKRLTQIGRLMPIGDTPAKARELELLASVHFLVKHRQVANADAGELVALLKRYEKDFSESEVARALAQLYENQLLSSRR